MAIGYSTIDAILAVGKKLSGYLDGTFQWGELDEAVRLSEETNPLFTAYMQKRAMDAICKNYLEEKALRKWASEAALPFFKQKVRIGIVMAGNIPLVGFQDLLCVLVSGAEPMVKLSSKDKYLFPILFPDIQYCSTEELLSTNIDALITMGGAKAADYYSKVFPNIPKLIRSSRFSAAVLSGHESDEELNALCEDISLYYGLGCRSVTHLFIGYNFDIKGFSERLSNQCNELVTDYSHSFFMKNRAIMTIDNLNYLASEPFVFQETKEFFLPMGVIGYSYYESDEDISSFVKNRNDIQKIYRNFGFAQRPSLDDYPDGADTLTFCLSIKR